MTAMMRVLRAGLLTTVQDQGRYGYYHMGLPRAGSLDWYSQALANYLAGNSADMAVLEITLQGPELSFTDHVTVGIAGAQFEVFVNDHLQDCRQALLLKQGDTLRFGRLLSGCRAYLAISGGFVLEPQLQSYSSYLPAALGGHQGRALQSGDQLCYNMQAPPAKAKHLSDEYYIDYCQQPLLRIVAGAESQLFNQAAHDAMAETFTITQQSNRMGYRLLSKHPLRQIQQTEILSTAVLPGTIQVPANGQAILILNDGQTTGGYARIANVIAADYHLLGQCKPGDNIRFYWVDQAKALALYRQKQQWLKQLFA